MNFHIKKMRAVSSTEVRGVSLGILICTDQTLTQAV